MWIRVAAASGFLAVALGAFGAHALRSKLAAPMLDVWKTAVLYHALHSVALLSLALYGQATRVKITVPAALFSAGILLFAGSLYALAASGVTRLGMITPFGGVAFLAGWVAVFVGLGRAR